MHQSASARLQVLPCSGLPKRRKLHDQGVYLRGIPKRFQQAVVQLRQEHLVQRTSNEGVFCTSPLSSSVSPLKISRLVLCRLAMSAMITYPAPCAPTVLARNTSTRVHRLAMAVMISMEILASIHVSIPGVPTASAPNFSATRARTTVLLSFKRNESGI